MPFYCRKKEPSSLITRFVTMLLKWLFTLLAILWLIQALKPYFQIEEPPRRPSPPPPPQNDLHVSRAPQKNDVDDGEYIDYEEIK
jgi:hypothetical protein